MDEEAPVVGCPSSAEIELLCVGNWAVLCNAAGRVVDTTNCRASEEACVARACDNANDCERCLTCKPNSVRCGADGSRERCTEDGAGYEPDDSCDESAGLFCDTISGECVDLCAEADAARSYIGCAYWAVPTSNSQLAYEGTDERGRCEPFSFAIVVANAQGIDAHVTVETPDGEIFEKTVPPNESKTIELPCSIELQGLRLAFTFDPEDPQASFPDPPERFSTLATASAHYVRSDVPVTVYQFNPLEYESEDSSGRVVYSYTNDASLLLPVSGLTGEYLVMSAATLKHSFESRFQDDSFDSPGFVTIVGTSDQPAEIEIISSAFTRASEDGSLPALEPGQHHTITLERGQVAQILSAAPEDCDGDSDDNLGPGVITYCEVSKDYDLTGTRIRSDQPVMVLAGHDCVFLPWNRWACDHIEEIMLPVEAWGEDILVSASEAIACQPRVPNMVRVLASRDDTRVSFAPATAHEPVTLDEGDFVDFEIENDVRVSASDAILVGQYLLGQDYEGIGSSGSFAKGDPSMSLGIPLAQWRDRYSILSPETITDNYVNIIAHENQIVLIDGRVVTGFNPIESTPLVSARVPVSGGQHTLESNATFGVSVYGYAVYTSYMLPGGLDLNLINGPD